MNLRCKPGDLAVVVTPSGRYNNLIVEVISLAPSGRFQMPDGYFAVTDGAAGPCWIVKLIGGAISLPLRNSTYRKGLYALCEDRCLRPLPGLPDDDEVTDKEVVA